MIDVNQLIQDILDESLDKAVVLALFKSDGTGTHQLKLGNTSRTAISAFFDKLKREGYNKDQIAKAFKDDALQFQDKSGNEIELKNVKIYGFNGSKDNPNTLYDLFMKA